MATTPFVVDPALTAIAINYRNSRLIADEVLPRVEVGSPLFAYNVFPPEETLTVPETRVGRKGRPNEVDFSAYRKQAEVVDYGLDDVVPQSDLDRAPRGYNPKDRAIEGIMDLVLLDREIRAAKVVTDPSNYPDDNRPVLSGSSQWNNPDSDPIGNLMLALDSMLVRATAIVVGRKVFSALSRHPKIVSAVSSGEKKDGKATQEQLATLFELERVIVGDAWINIAKRGQPLSRTRAWGNTCALLHINRAADTRQGVTFGLTAVFGNRVASQIPESNVGLRGGIRVRAGESVAEVVVAREAGFLFQNAVAA